MKFRWFLDPSACLYDAPDSGGGGGDSGGDTSGSFDSGGGGSPEPAVPDIPEVDDNYTFRLKGQDKPIKLSEYRAGFQSQATKASQEAARLRQEVAQYKQREAQAEQQRQAQARQAAGQGQDNFLASLEQLPYLDGPHAKQVIDRIYGELRQRDQITIAALQELQKMRQTVSSLNEAHVGATFDSKISRWLQEGGYPDNPAAKKFAQILYLAHEGQDLDQEFPQLLKQHWGEFQSLIESERAAKVAANRKPPFLPGRGGATGPTKPIQLDPRLTSHQVADQLFDLFREEG
jgi:hypothetical protein